MGVRGVEGTRGGGERGGGRREEGEEGGVKSKGASKGTLKGASKGASKGRGASKGASSGRREDEVGFAGPSCFEVTLPEGSQTLLGVGRCVKVKKF